MLTGAAHNERAVGLGRSWFGRSRGRRAGWIASLLAMGVGLTATAADPCPDINGDGVLDNGDIGAFVAVFLAGDPQGDFNGDGVLDNGDIGAFVSLYLLGAPCTPELEFVGGQVNGSLPIASSTPPTFLDQHVIAAPATINPLPGITNNATVYAAGTDTDGSRVLVLRNTVRREFVIDRENAPPQVFAMTGDGVNYPDAFNTLPTDDPEFMYEPFSARVHDGLVMVMCDAHWFRGGVDPSLTPNWDVSNTVAVLWKNLDDTDWNIIRDSHNPTFAQYGAVWAMGVPILPGPDTLLVGWANYQWKFQWNGPNQAFLSQFDKGPDGRWTHGVSLNMLEDGSAPENQHFHTVQPYWTGSQLRVFIPIGDGSSQNGIYEMFRDDLDLATGATPKPGAREIMLPGPGWTDAGYVHGGQPTGGFNRYGMQPTYMLPLNGRLHCGGDESFPAIVSFDPNRPGGTPIDDLRPEYLPHSPDVDSGVGWLSLTGDVNDYANPTAAAVMVQPSASWAGSSDRANRVVYNDGDGWGAVSHVETLMTYGAAIGPNDTVYVGSSTGGASITPGALRRYTPLLSSTGATNAINEPSWFSFVVGGDRATITDITDQPELVGPNPFLEGTRVLRVRANTSVVWTGTSYARHMAQLSDRDMLAEGDDFQVRYWLRPIGARGLKSKVVPIKAGAGEFLMASESGAALATTDRQISLTTNEWGEFLDLGRVIEPLGEDLFGFGLSTSTQMLGGFSTVFDYDLAVEGLYVNADEFILQRPGFGQTLPDSDNVIPLATATLPIEIHGISMPLGASAEQQSLVKSRNLCTLWIDSSNYFSIDAYLTADSIRYVGRVNGQLYLGKIDDVTWTRATPVSFKIENDGTDLVVRASTYGGPWSEPVSIPEFGSMPWEQFQLFGLTGQGHLGLASFKATPN